MAGKRGRRSDPPLVPEPLDLKRLCVFAEAILLC